MIQFLRILCAGMLAALLLSGCTAPRTVQQDAAIRSVAVVSLLSEAGPVNHQGLTIFNNHEGHVDQGGKLREVAHDTIAQRLRQVRPNWTVKVNDADLAPMHEKLKNKPLLTDEIPYLSSELSELARRLDVDALFVLLDTKNDNYIGRGVGIDFRALMNEPDHVFARAQLALVLVDRNAQRLLGRGATKEDRRQVPNSAIGLRSDMSTLNDPQVRAAVSRTMQTQLKAALEEALSNAGY